MIATTISSSMSVKPASDMAFRRQAPAGAGTWRRDFMSDDD